MGREIRRVPPGWEHPRDENGHHKPMYEENYMTRGERWIKELMEWERGENKDREEYGYRFFWDWHGPPPKEEYYVPYEPQNKTDDWWWQVYETVSEGTPVTPPFPTKEELIDHLCSEGESLVSEKYRHPPLTRETAKAFVEQGWVPSMAICGGRLLRTYEAAKEEA